MLTAAELMLLAEELDEALAGAKVQKIHEPRPERFTFGFHRHDGRRKLLVVLEAGHVRAHLSEAESPNPERPSAFVERLRELLVSARVARVESLPGERILRLHFGALENGHPVERRMILELFARSRNLVITDGSGEILALLREGGKNRPNLRLKERWTPPPSPAAGPAPGPPPFSWLPEPAGRGALSAAVEAWAGPREDASRLDEGRETALVELRRRLKKDERLLENVRGDVERASRAEALRREADLLQQNLATLVAASGEVNVTDWSDGEARQVAITLDAGETPASAMQRRFAEAKKLEKVWAHASAELGRVEDRVRELRAAEGAIAGAEDEEALEAALAAARERGLLPKAPATPPAAPAAKTAPKVEERRCYRTFESADGIPILVGRTAQDNDELTFRVARGNDLWLHVADHPGSHVVVRAEGEVPESTLLDAATLAAHFSRAPKGAKTLVSWTRRKFVKKFKGAAAGQVQLAERRSIRLRPEPDRLQRLLAQGKKGT